MKKIIISLCAILMILAQGTVAFAGIMPDEVVIENESAANPNNSRTTADVVEMVGPTSHYIIGVVSDKDTEDWFEIRTNTNTGEGIYLFSEGSGMDYDVYLYDSNGGYISSATGSDKEISNIFIRANSTYYLRVQYVSGDAVEPYEIHYYVN